MDLTVLSQDQKAKLNQFKDATKGWNLPDESDDYLLRWLVARNFDVAKAEKMLQNSLKWRKLYRADEMPETWTGSEVLVKYMPGGYSGFDKFGCLVCITPYGRLDTLGLLRSVTKREFVKYNIWFKEKGVRLLKENSTAPGKPVTRMTFVCDLEQFSIRDFTHKANLEINQQLTVLYEDNYPEDIRKIFVVNAPKTFTIAYGMTRPFLSESTLKKVQVFGTNDAEWKKALLEDIDPSQLPVHYGGTMTDPDGNPYCLTKICMGGQVPSSYYLSNNPVPPNKNYTVMNVSNRAKAQLEFQTSEPGSTLRWDFVCSDDIVFTVYQKNPDGELIEVLPRERINTNTAAEIGEIICDEPGIYLVEWDNSFSYLRSKTIRYQVDIRTKSPAFLPQ